MLNRDKHFNLLSKIINKNHSTEFRIDFLSSFVIVPISLCLTCGRYYKQGEGKITYTFSVSVNAFSVEFLLACYQQAGRVWYVSRALWRMYMLFYPTPYKHMTIINDDSSVVIKWSSKLIDAARGVIYDTHVYSTGHLNTEGGSITVPLIQSKEEVNVKVILPPFSIPWFDCSTN